MTIKTPCLLLHLIWKPLAIASIPFFLCSAALIGSTDLQGSGHRVPRATATSFEVKRGAPILTEQELLEDDELNQVATDVAEFLSADPAAFDIDELTADLALTYGAAEQSSELSNVEYFYYVDKDGVVRRICVGTTTIVVRGRRLLDDVHVEVVQTVDL